MSARERVSGAMATRLAVGMAPIRPGAKRSGVGIWYPFGDCAATVLPLRQRPGERPRPVARPRLTAAIRPNLHLATTANIAIGSCRNSERLLSPRLDPVIDAPGAS